MAFVHIEPPFEPNQLPEYLSRVFQEIESTFTQEKLWAGGQRWVVVTGTPEGQIAAPVGSLATRTDGGASTTLYVKESGSGTTGWVAK